MKKLGKLCFSIFVFFTMANKAFAASTETEEAGLIISDILPFVLGIILILCVLFIGYKMDKASENAPTMKKVKVPKQKKKKEKLVKNISSKVEEDKTNIEENRESVPYETDEDYEDHEEDNYKYNDYGNEDYEDDNDFDFDELDEDTEYDQDDMSLFNMDSNTESRFNDIDEEISYNIPNYEEEPQNEEPFMENQIEDNIDLEYTDPFEKSDEKEQDEEVPEESLFDPDEQFANMQSSQLDINFLDQMEENLKREQEERRKRTNLEIEDSDMD